MNCFEEANGIYSLPLFSSADCKSVLNRNRQSTRWQSARVGSQDESGEVHSVEDTEFRAASVLFPENAPRAAKLLSARIEESVRPAVREIWELDLPECEGVQFVRYAAGGHYNPHADAALDLNDRYFTAVCYLNDDFEGGGTTFPYLNDFRIMPQAGKVILFPSRYVHCAEPVSKGEKYIAVTWLHGPQSVRWI
jgi:predicted 2-oxoglutarate/Fe(II)-dependent dioxygenase YbiX